MQSKVSTKRTRQVQSDEREYRLYTALLFPFAFLTVLAQRIWPRPRSPYLSAKDHSPFFSEVIDLCRSSVPWVFMGR